jgi:hypothetical protein
VCLSGHNGVYGTYTELQWCFLKVASCSDVSQIAKNCSGIKPILSISTEKSKKGFFDMFNFYNKHMKHKQ